MQQLSPSNASPPVTPCQLSFPALITLQMRLTSHSGLRNQLLAGGEALSEINNLATELLLSGDSTTGNNNFTTNVTAILLEDLYHLTTGFSKFEIAVAGVAIQ